MIHWTLQWLLAIATVFDSMHGGLPMADEKQTDDEGTIDIALVARIAGLATTIIPGKGGEQHLKNVIWELGKFLDARSEELDEWLDVDG